MTRPILAAALAVALLVPRTSLSAQEATPPADPAGVASIDAIITAVYEAISGPAGQPRDWDRFRSLFLPDARLIPTRVAPTDGGFDHLVTSTEGYIRQFGPGLERNGFHEREIHRVEERYGPVAHVFSTYESRWNADDAEPFARGINSFQLFWDGERWWVVDVYWFGEAPSHPIPEEYLPGTG